MSIGQSPSAFVGKRAVVSGATGFIGQHLARALWYQGAEVTALVRPDSAAQHGLGTVVAVDLLSCDAVCAACDAVDPHFVIHLARLQTPGVNADTRAAYQANVAAGINMIAAAERLGGLECFVTLGSCEEYGLLAPPFEETMQERPVTDYGLAKLAVTQITLAAAKMTALPALVLRPSVVYGPGQRPPMFLPSMIDTVLGGRSFPMSAGAQTRDFVYIDDLVAAILAAMVTPAAMGEVINISSGVPIPILELATMTARMIAPDGDVLLRPGALPYQRDSAMNYFAANQRANQLLGWVPAIPLAQGLQRTIDAYRVQEKGDQA